MATKSTSFSRICLASLTGMFALLACGDDSPTDSRAYDFHCAAGEEQLCSSCPDGLMRVTRCSPSGDVVEPCPCSQPPLNPIGETGGAGGMLSGGSGGAGGAAGMAGVVAGAAGAGGSGGVSGVGAATGGIGGMAGMAGMTGGTGGAAGANGESGGAGGMMASGGTGGGGNPDDPLDEMRQLCVDTINMYRATLGLEPLVRATPEQEMCTDEGARMDAESGRAHGSAGMCELGSQNTCPGYPVGGWGGGTLASTFERCMQQMWDEGEPPVSRSECERDYAGCFLQHGHYLNMSDPRATTVGCGFYDMGDDTWWMNQNFALDWRR